jgi:uncharacterized membrane protein
LGLSFPLVVHLSILADNPVWSIYWLAILLLLHLLKKLSERNALSGGMYTMIAASSILVLIATSGHGGVIYLLPILINLALLVVFARSLLPGEVPLITHFATRMDGALSVTAIQYTRSVTVVWSVYFFAMTVVGVLLAAFAPVEVWSYVVNCLQYVLIPLIFIAEFLVRRHVLRNEVVYGFGTFIKRLLTTAA